jgi:alpha-mannosidase
VLSGPARLELRYENPRNWPAWNQDWADRQRPAKDFVGQASTAGGTPAPHFKVVENGPARVAVEVTRECEGSTFTQRIRLASGSDRVEFDTDIDWRSRERSLRAAFPLVASCPTATFDIQTGAITRGSGTPRQFEYQFHRWMDLTDTGGSFGASILCDSKYGCDKPDDHTLRLTLLHTPGTHGGYSDQGTQDLGRHHVTYALVGHSGGWAEAGVPQEAARLNQPLQAFVASPHEGAMGTQFSLIRSADPDVEITALKKAEASDEVIVRLRELSGKGAKAAHIAMARPIVGAREVDGQEREIGAATVQNGELVTDVHGFGLRAFALKLGVAPAKLAKVKSAPIELTFDTDVVSTNANRAGGAFDEAGGTIPAEQYPATIAAEGVTFKLGSGADGQKNAVSCRGQEIAIPSGDFNRLYLLAAANEEVSTSVKVDGQAAPLTVGAWTGFVGQWDRRFWKTTKTEPSLADLTGIEPGYVKPEPVAWYCSHHHTKAGDAYYEYCYLYKCAIELPNGAHKVTLPSDPRIKVMAASVADVGAARAMAAAPLFDTLKDHVQDAPIITPASGTFSDATELTIEPRLYWKGGAVHYTLDGSEPGMGSPVYGSPIVLSKGATIKAAVVGEDGKMGPASSAKVDVNDTTPPKVTKVVAAFGAPSLRVDFSEPLDASAAEAARYSIEPALAVKSGTLSADKRSVTLALAGSPESGRVYHVKVSGVKDASPAGNTLKDAGAEFKVSGPVFSMDEVGLAKYGTSIKDVPGLPVKAHDPWTISMWVKVTRQPRNRTLFAGFGKCAQMTDGQGRYLAKFGSGAHFWSHNEDLEGSAPLELNAWQMLTATCDGKTLRLYKDGKKVAERGAELADDENVVWIAPKEPWESKYQFEGDMHGLTIWNEALSQEAIEAVRASAKLP